MSTTTEALEALVVAAVSPPDDFNIDVPAIERHAATIRAALEGERRLQAKLERVEGLAREVANDLEAELYAGYGASHGHPEEIHPAMRAKYERDMAPVRELREALSGGEEGT